MSSPTKANAPAGTKGISEDNRSGSSATSIPRKPLFMPANAPLPTPTWDPALNRTMLYAPPFRTMDLNTQCVMWDVFCAGHEYALHQAQDAACGCDHDQIFLQGAAWAERRIQAETDAILRDQFDQIRRSDLTPFWVLSERRGDTKRAAEALARAKERGYYA